MTVTFVLVLVGVLATSTLSGVLGMGGGILLMGLFTALLPVAAAMMLHGAAQLAANASRAVIHRKHIHTKVLVPYIAGTLITTGVFLFIRFMPPKALVYALLGAFPFLALLLPKSAQLDVTKGPHAFLCGVVVQAMQLMAGASGPILDVFFFNAKLDKHQVVATKALTQSIGHTLKLVFYGTVASQAAAGLPLWLVGACVALALVGTMLGTKVLDRMSDTSFRRYSRYAIMAIGVFYLVRSAQLSAVNVPETAGKSAPTDESPGERR